MSLSFVKNEVYVGEISFLIYCFHIPRKLFFSPVKFIYCEREREREKEKETASWGGAEREGGRERILSRLCALSGEPDARLNIMNCEMMA